jgi:hypothetical protein
MVAADPPGQFSLASNDQTAAATLVEDLRGAQLEIEFEHGGL